MKKFVAAAIALSMIGTSAMAAPYPSYGSGPNRGHVEQSYRQGSAKWDNSHQRVSQNRYVQWKKGDRFDRHRATNYRVINSPRTYRLYNPPRGYHWVRSGNDAVLVGITSGIVAAIMANALR